jgi:hypothetical protein
MALPATPIPAAASTPVAAAMPTDVGSIFTGTPTTPSAKACEITSELTDAADCKIELKVNVPI